MAEFKHPDNKSNEQFEGPGRVVAALSTHLHLAAHLTHNTLVSSLHLLCVGLNTMSVGTYKGSANLRVAHTDRNAGGARVHQ